MISETARRLAEMDIAAVERVLIGGILLDGGQPKPLPPLLVEEFHHEGCRAIWQAILDLDRRREPITPVTVWFELNSTGQLERAGGAAALAMAELEGCIEVHRPRYATMIREAARRRAIRRLGVELQEQGLEEEEIRARLEAMPGPLAPAVFDAIEVMDTVMRGWRDVRIRTGLDRLDDLTGGMARGQVIVVAAITSHGKTAFACELASRVAASGIRVDYFTLEETREGIVRRLTAGMTGLSIHSILTGAATPEEQGRLAVAAYSLRQQPLVVTAPGDAMRSLRAAHVLEAVGHAVADVVIVDHLQKIVTTQDSRAYGLEAVMNELHGLALRDNKVIVVTAQVGREANSQKRVPRESDLRDSGALEMFARQLWVLYWPHKHDQTQPMNKYEVYVLKNSEGPTGSVRLVFTPRSGSFTTDPFS